jgi:hypothetical protein
MKSITYVGLDVHKRFRRLMEVETGRFGNWAPANRPMLRKMVDRLSDEGCS